MVSSDQLVLEKLCGYARQTALLESIQSLLGWDERTLMPAAGAEHRAEQMTLLSGLIHGRWTAEEFGRWLGQLRESPLAADPHSDTGATIRRLDRQYQRRVRVPKSLVEELTRTAVLGQQAWQEARGASDFARFLPWLEKMVRLKRQEAEAVGYEDCPYDALLDEYEPDERTANVARALGELRDALVPLVARIAQSPRQPDRSILRRRYPVQDQLAVGREAASRIGFDFHRGRLDTTAHPFCSTIGPNDCRITTRFDEHEFGQSFFSILHEAGHGIYEQGLRTDEFGLPLGTYTSLGIHESQSRLWENLVGRSRPFWQYFYPRVQSRFPAALGEVSLEEFHFAVNDVRPSLIRVEADEATYNLHILVRFELEQALLSGDLAPRELPGAWAEKYRTYLGVEPSNDAEGVLQDIHWASGAVGYFPTYTLGNLYAAQLFRQAEADLGGLAGPIRRGQFETLRAWLREKVYQHGQRYSAAELVQRATGRPLDHRPLIDHLRSKFEPLYGV
ncbi:MAG TPA: carboxypeptidase M32 [Planctomycetaceae bacterium]|nr:carboxypeptidase M32 [Planctomycetaceae bacterium]